MRRPTEQLQKSFFARVHILAERFLFHRTQFPMKKETATFTRAVSLPCPLQL